MKRAPKSGHGKKTTVHFLFWRKVGILLNQSNHPTTMSKRILTQEQINELLANPNVLRCSEKSITYHPDFKVKATMQYQDGLSARTIFQQAGFNLNVIGRKNPKDQLKTWRAVVRQKGIDGLRKETRGGPGRRRGIKQLDDQEKMKYLETQVAYLKAENAFLAKLRKQRLN